MKKLAQIFTVSLILTQPVFADDYCSDAAGGECEATESMFSGSSSGQDDYTGGPSDDSSSSSDTSDNSSDSSDSSDAGDDGGSSEDTDE